jgi:prephenate dehydrogenase
VSVHFRRVAVVGLGLLGGSLARALRERGLADEVVGTGRRADALAAACRSGVVDRTAEVEEAVAGADLVVLATPVGAMAALLERAAPHLGPDCVVTDVGSVKGPVVETLPGRLPTGVHFVGSHPMAGSHLRGVEHARADLFEGAPCVVTPSGDADAAAVERVEALWRALGARVVRRSPDAHDAQVAWTSHVPHVLAFAFARALGAAPAEAAEVSGTGFRDFTRIAHSDPELWSDILCANRKALSGPLQRAAEELAALARAVEAGDAEAAERALADARESLARFAPAAADDDSNARSGGFVPGNHPALSGDPKE